MGSVNRGSLRWYAMMPGLVVWLSVLLLAHSLVAAEMVRKWRDTSGKFEVDATLIDRSEAKVKLKKADGSVIEVPIEKLSEADRDYLKKAAEPEPAPSDNPFGGAKPAAKRPVLQPKTPRPKFPKAAKPAAADKTSLPDAGKDVALVQGDAPQGLEPDPAPSATPISEGGFLTSDVDAYDKVSMPVWVNQEKKLAAVSIGRNIINRQEENRGRIYLGVLPGGPPKLVWDVKEPVQLLDHDAATDRTLIMSGLDSFERGGDIVVLEGLSTGAPKELLRRRLPGIDKPGFKPQVGWGALLDGETMIATIDQKMFVWNLVSAELLYKVEKLEAGKIPTLSPGRRYLAIPNARGVTIVNPIDGESLGFLVASDVTTPEVAFHHDGQRIALCDGNQLVVFDYVAGEEPVNCLLARTLGSRPVGWVGDDLLLSNLGDLIDTNLQVVLWSYSVTGLTKAIAVPGGILATTTSQKCNLLTLPVPSAGATSAATQLAKMGAGLMLVQPGTEVSLMVEAPDGVDREQLLKALKEAVDRTGWKIVPKAETTVAAIIGRGQQQQLQFRSGPGLQGGVETAAITPFTANLEIRRGQNVLWTRRTANHVPSLLFLRNGETLQQAVSKYERPDAEFFARLQLPPRVPKPELAAGLGTSRIENNRWTELAAGGAAGNAPVRRTNRPGGKK